MDVEELFHKAKNKTLGDLKPLSDLATTTQNPGGQFRVKWLRRCLISLWLLAVVLTHLMIGLDLLALYGSIAADLNLPSGHFISVLAAYGRSLSITSLICDLWVAVALIHLGSVWGDRSSEYLSKPKVWVLVVCLVIVLGRPSSFFYMFLISIFPNSWWVLWPIKFVLFPPLILIISGLVNLFLLYTSVTLFILTVILIPIKIFQSLFEISKSLYLVDVQSTMFLGSLVKFWNWFTMSEPPQQEQATDDSKGARFAVPEEIEALRTNEGMVFGHVNGQPLFLKNEKHVLVMASTRSGKGVSLIIPHLLRYAGSAFVLDPKGENALVTGRQRGKLNDQVHYLDPFGISGQSKSRFNPLARFTSENMEAESKALAAAIVMGEGGKRDHWTASAQQLLAAFILHVVTSPSILPKEKDLGHVRMLLLGKMNKVLELMAESDAADGLLSRLAISFLQTPEKEFGSIVSTAQRETEILDNPFIVASLAASGPGEEVDFADWHKGTMSVFLCLSAPKFPVFNRWLRLVLTSALDEMTDTLNPPALPVCFMLDELATLGHLQAVENAVGLSAGYGIQLVTVFQDVAQMRDLYKGRWASFVGNAGVRALFSLDDYETAKYWSQFMGGRIYETASQQKDIYGLTKGQSKGETMRPLRSPEQLMLDFAQDKMLVLPQGSRPVVSDRVPYFRDGSLINLWDDPRNNGQKN